MPVADALKPQILELTLGMVPTCCFALPCLPDLLPYLASLTFIGRFVPFPSFPGKLKVKDLVEFLKPFAGPKGGASASAGKDSSKSAGKSAGKDGDSGTSEPSADGKPGGNGGSSSSSGASKPFAEQQAADGAKATKGKQEAEKEVHDPVSAVVDLLAKDLPAVLEGDDAWLFGVFEGEDSLHFGICKTLNIGSGGPGGGFPGGRRCLAGLCRPR